MHQKQGGKTRLSQLKANYFSSFSFGLPTWQIKLKKVQLDTPRAVCKNVFSPSWGETLFTVKFLSIPLVQVSNGQQKKKEFLVGLFRACLTLSLILSYAKQ